MNILALLLAVVSAVLLFRVERKWAPVPFLLGALYMTYGQEVEIGPVHFTTMRLMIAVGVLRILAKGERISGGIHSMDRLMIAWAVWNVCSSVFHKDIFAALVSHLGFVYNSLGVYWLMRVFIQNLDDFLLVIKALLILLIPLAAEMMLEQVTAQNLFGSLGGLKYGVEIRNGRIRAQGPFGHAILAGTAGASCLPFALMFWRRNRRLALVGMGASAAVIVASASSGPILTAFCTLAAVAMWKFRHQLRLIRWGGIIAILGLNIVMNDPVYYLMARVDLVGGSTGWHRAALIDSALKHLHEWWLAGTDYTRHWMPTGIQANDVHTDITNYYIYMGVVGGLPLLLLFAWLLIRAFGVVGEALRANAEAPIDDQFIIWTLGAILFGHATTFMSIPYFDQTVCLLYLLLASIGSLHAAATAWAPAGEAEASWPEADYEPRQSQA